MPGVFRVVRSMERACRHGSETEIEVLCISVPEDFMKDQWVSTRCFLRNMFKRQRKKDNKLRFIEFQHWNNPRFGFVCSYLS